MLKGVNEETEKHMPTKLIENQVHVQRVQEKARACGSMYVSAYVHAGGV